MCWESGGIMWRVKKTKDKKDKKDQKEKDAKVMVRPGPST
jgi:hypothetical protein